MKKTLLLTTALFAVAMTASAQFKVLSDGKITIGTTAQPLSDISINSEGATSFYNSYKGNLIMMRTFFLITLLALLPTLSFGQDVYHTFLEEGKVWNFHYHKPFTNGGSDKSIVVKGDTVIGETTYKKIVNVSNNQCEIVMRENKRKIYYLNPNGNESLIYDFGLNVGDVFHLESESTVIAVDTIIVGDHAFRALKLVGEWDKEHCFWWVEGIGNLCYLINSIPAPGDYYTFLQCQLGEEVLFSQNDFKTLDEYTGIDKTRIKENSFNNPLFDLQGRRIQGQPHKGMYIQGGKKYVK